MAKLTKIDGGALEPDPDNKSTIFISHRMEDGEIAKDIGNALSDLSAKIELYIAGNCDHRNAEFGSSSLKEDIARVLDKTELVLILYTHVDEDWSWVMWETGVATDPRKPDKTRIVPLSLTGAVPKVLEGQLVVRLDDNDSIRAFVKQLCTTPGFFPGLDGPLTDRAQKWIDTKADALFAKLKNHVRAETKRWRRCDRFFLNLDAKAVKKLEKSEKLPTKKLMGEIADCAKVIEPSEQVGSHFALAKHLDAPTLAQMRKSWERRRDEVGIPLAETRPWTTVLIEELWRICSGDAPSLKWEPFLSVSSNDWLYPLVIEYAVHPDGSYEFDVAVVSTLKPGETVPGE